MWLRHALISSALLVVAQLTAAQPASQPLERQQAMLEQMHSVAKRLSFSGTFVHQQDAVLHTSTIVQMVNNNQAITKVQALDGQRQEVIKTPNEIRTYLPERQMIKVDQTSLRRAAFPDMFAGSPEQVLRNYVIEQGGQMRIADVDAVELLLKPRHESRWSLRVWVDRKTNLIVKCQKIDAAGNTIEQAAFTELKIGPRTRVSATPSFASTKDWKVHDASMKALGVPATLKFKPESLKGFELLGVFQRASTPEDPAGMRRYVLTDGLATVSVFIQSKSVAGPLNDKVRRRGALTMLSREIQGAWVTVMGDVPPETLQQFAQTIEWKTTP
jgi:sigma-E factor negative regulatory protein RseB